MKYYGLDLDECFDELWPYLEQVQDGYAVHTIAISQRTKHLAAIKLADSLIPFFEKHMYESDDCGKRNE